MDNKLKISLTINNKLYNLEVEARLLLVDLLRTKLGLTGTHVGCDTSQCGSCIVLLDDNCIKACSILAVQCNGKEIKTIEFIGTKEKMHNIQEAFKKNHSLQCGFCTPGIIMTAIEMKKYNIKNEKQIRDFLDGNFCRCTGYHNIVKAISDYLKVDRENV